VVGDEKGGALRWPQAKSRPSALSIACRVGDIDFSSSGGDAFGFGVKNTPPLADLECKRFSSKLRKCAITASDLTGHQGRLIDAAILICFHIRGGSDR